MVTFEKKPTTYSTKMPTTVITVLHHQNLCQNKDYFNLL